MLNDMCSYVVPLKPMPERQVSIDSFGGDKEAYEHWRLVTKVTEAKCNGTLYPLPNWAGISLSKGIPLQNLEIFIVTRARTSEFWLNLQQNWA